MKQRKKQNGIRLLAYSLLLLFSVFLNNCQKVDDEQTQTIQQKSELKITIVHGDEHFAKSNPKIYNTLKQVSRSNVLSRNTEYSEDYDFYFNLDNIQIIEKTTYTQYTVVVESENTGDALLNYVLLDYLDGEALQYLVTYPRIDGDIDHANASIQSLDGQSLLARGFGSNNCLDGVPILVDVTQQYICTEKKCSLGNHGLEQECNCETWVNGQYIDCTRAYNDCGWQSVNVWSCGGSSNPDPDNGGNNTGGGNHQGDGDDNEEEDDEHIETVALDSEVISHQKNCNELNELIANATIKSKINILKLEVNYMSLQNEKGFTLAKTSSGLTTSGNIVMGSKNNINYGGGPNKFGGVHLHQINGTFPMFSTYDIIALNSFYTNFDSQAMGSDESLPVHIVVTAQGVYALKINDVTKLLTYANNLDTEAKREREFEKLNDIFNKIYNFPNSFASNYQREFLKYAKDLGASLYMANNDLTAWERKELNESTNIVKPIKCNQ